MLGKIDEEQGNEKALFCLVDLQLSYRLMNNDSRKAIFVEVFSDFLFTQQILWPLKQFPREKIK